MIKHTLPAAVAALALSAPLAAQRAPTDAPSDQAVAKLRDAALQDDVAWDITEGLTTEVGQRLAGTEAEARARDWAVVKLKALGFRNVRIEPFDMPVWVRGQETAEVVAPYPQKLTLAALGTSGATPPEGITAEVAMFATLDALKAAPAASVAGQIVYIGNSMRANQDGSGYGPGGAPRRQGAAIAAAKGALAVIIRPAGTDSHRNPHAGGTNFPAGTTAIPAASLSNPDADQLERIARRGKPIRLHLTLTPRMTGTGQSGNVIAEVPGSDSKAGIVLVGGHLDSWDLGTGAIDDASGVAITTAAAKRIMDAGRPRRTIRVVWFGAEEEGGFGGVAYAKAHGGEYHATASESDFGADRIWKFDVNLPASAKAVGERLAAALTPIGVVAGKDIAGDGTDVGPIMRAGAAAIDLAQDGTRYFDYHHTPDDTLDKVDPAQLRQNVAAWTAMLATVANASEEIGKVTPKP